MVHCRSVWGPPWCHHLYFTYYCKSGNVFQIRLWLNKNLMASLILLDAKFYTFELIWEFHCVKRGGDPQKWNWNRLGRQIIPNPPFVSCFYHRFRFQLLFMAGIDFNQHICTYIKGFGDKKRALNVSEIDIWFPVNCEFMASLGEIYCSLIGRYFDQIG